MVESKKYTQVTEHYFRLQKILLLSEDNVKIRRALDLAVEACGDKITITGEPKFFMLCLLQELLQERWDLGLHLLSQHYCMTPIII